MSLTVELYRDNWHSSGDKSTGKSVLAGSVLDGCVTFTCHEEITGVQMFVARLVGTESAMIEHTVTVPTKTYRNGRYLHGTKEVTKVARSTRTIVQASIPVGERESLVEKGGVIHPGSYTMPFSIQIPHDLPSSMSFSKKNKNRGCYLRYAVEAEMLHEYQGYANRLLRSIRGTGSFPLTSPPSTTSAVPYHGDPTIVNLQSSFCCVRRGQMALVANADNTHLRFGQSTNVVVAVRNRSSKVLKPRAYLHQSIGFNADHQWESSYKMLCSTTFPPNTAFDESIKGEIDEDTDIPKLLKELRNGENCSCASIQLPVDAFPTYDGQFLRVSHELQIDFDSGNKDATVSIPIVSKASVLSSSVEIHEEQTKVRNNHDGEIVGQGTTPKGIVQDPNAKEGFVYVPASDFDFGETPNTTCDGTKEDSPGLQKLLSDTKSEAEIDAIRLIKEYTKDPEWQTMLACVTPLQYGMAFGTDYRHVYKERIDIAEAIASCMSNADDDAFRCDHVVEVLKNRDGWYRCEWTERLLPYCSDFGRNKGRILAVLCDWDRCWSHAETRTMIEGLLAQKELHLYP